MHGRSTAELAAFQRRLDRQAEATRALRQPLYRRVGLERARTVLDVGCGSGAVTRDLVALGPEVTGIDVDARMTHRSRDTGARVLCADGACMPFTDAAFDAAVCNLGLLWARDPARVVAEMARVVRPGGVVLASMEPDYGGKIQWPTNPLVDIVFQGRGVARRGGDPQAGRKLRDHFVRAGLLTEVGIANTQVATPEQDLANFRRSRTYYRRLLHEGGFTTEDIDAWEDDYLRSLEAGIALCFLPLFYAIGRKPTRGDVRP